VELGHEGSMIMDCFGDEVVVAILDPAKFEFALGQRHITARRPDLYGILVERNPHLGPGARPDV